MHSKFLHDYSGAAEKIALYMTIIEPVFFIFLLGMCYDISNIMNVYVKKITHVMVFMIVLRCGNDDDCDDHCLPK